MPIKKDPRKRVMKATDKAKAGLEVSETTMKMMGDKNNFIAVDDKGIYIKGKVSFINDGTNIRRGGLFVQMPDFTRMIPSTIVTLNPVQIPVPPISGISDIQKDLAFFLALMI
jgi:hypothetical protein